MGLLLLAALIGVPLVEIAIFIQVGGWIGLWPTLALVVLTAVVGSWQLRAQGFATLARARTQMDRGVLPARELFDGLCLLVAGALLLTPGFFTDAIGLLLFMPGLRDALRRRVGGYLAAHAETRVNQDPAAAGRGGPGRRPTRGGATIEGDYVDITEEDHPQAESEREGDGPPPRDRGT